MTRAVPVIDPDDMQINLLDTSSGQWALHVHANAPAASSIHLMQLEKCLLVTELTAPMTGRRTRGRPRSKHEMHVPWLGRQVQN